MNFVMRISFFWFACAIAAFPFGSSAQEKVSNDGLSCGDAVWIVNAKVDGKPGAFRIAIESRQSCVSSRFLGSSTKQEHEEVHDVCLAGQHVRNVSVGVVASGEKCAIDGILGSDVLSHFCIGFDLNTAEVFVWENEATERVAKNWVLQAPLMQGTAGVACRMPFDEFSAGRVVFACGNPQWGISGILSTCTPVSRMQPQLTDRIQWLRLKTIDVPYQFEPKKMVGESGVGLGLRVGSALAMPLWGYSLDDKELPWYGRYKIGLQLMIDDLPTRRVVINYKERFLCFEQLSKEGMCSWLATRWTGWPLSIKNGALCIDPSYGPRMSPARDARVPWARVQSIGNISAEDILAVLRNPTVQGIAKLSPILDPLHPSRAKLSTDEADYDMAYTK